MTTKKELWKAMKLPGVQDCSNCVSWIGGCRKEVYSRCSGATVKRFGQKQIMFDAYSHDEPHWVWDKRK